MLLLTLLAAGTYQAEAARGNAALKVGYQNSMNTDAELVISTDQPGMNSTTALEPYVKDGAGTASVISSGTMNNAFYVREGAVRIGNGSEGEQVTVILNAVREDTLAYVMTGANSSFSVAGKNASVILDNATLQSGVNTSMVVGSPDGNGTLNITNGSFVDNHTSKGINFIIGAATSSTNHYNAHIHATYLKNPVFLGIGGTKYSGDYTTMADGKTQIGAGYVTVSNNSKLFCGDNGLVLGEGSLTVSCNSSVYAGYEQGTTNSLGVPNTPCGQADNYESSLGAIAGATSVVNITDGSSVNFGTGLKLGAFDDTTVTVNVGKDSQLNMAQRSSGAGKTYMGVKFNVTGSLGTYDRTWTQTGAAKSSTTVNVTEGGSVNLQEAYMGHSANAADAETVTVNIDEESAFTAASLQMDNGAVVTNKGVMQIAGALTVNGGKLVNSGSINGVVSFAAGDSADIITITDGEVVNSGTIGSAVEMSGGTLVLEDGSSVAGISATGGNILVDGEVFMSGNLEMDDTAALIFADDATIDLGDHEFVFNGGSIALTLTDQDISDIVLFKGAEVDIYTGREITLLDAEGNNIGSVQMSYNADGTVTLNTAAVPEPTSSMLGLMGLVAFTLRRRRK